MNTNGPVDGTGSATRVAWLATEALPQAVLDRFAARLPPVAAARAERLRRAADRRAFLAGRLLLAALTTAEGAGPAVRLGPGGKPRFAKGGPDFSISHSGGWVAVAMGGAAAVGVDLEPIDRPVDAMALAEGVLAAEEQAALRVAPPADRAAQFLAAWTVKEAWAKARGLGLSADLTQIRLDLGTGVIHLADESAWSICLYHPEPGFHLALARLHPHAPALAPLFARARWAGDRLRFDHASISPEAANRSATSARSINPVSSSSAKIAADDAF